MGKSWAQSIDGALARKVDPVPHNGDVVVTAHVGRNDVLFADVARLYVPDGATVADVTYGKGGFWKKVDTTRFNLLVTDLMTGVDFRNLPYDDGSIDVLVFDPPYIYNPKGTVKDSISGVYQANESQASIATTSAVIDLYEGGMKEARRVLRADGLLMVKCQDGIESGKPRWNHVTIANIGVHHGFVMRDMFVLVQPTQPTIRWPHQLHARKNHSYLWVMEKTSLVGEVMAAYVKAKNGGPSGGIANGSGNESQCPTSPRSSQGIVR